MSTSAVETSKPSAAQTASGGAKKILLALILAPLAALIAVEIATLQSEQWTEQKRREIAMAGGKCETERRVPPWLQNFVGAEFHSPLDRTTIVKVEMKGPTIGDAQLAKLQGLPDITELELEDSLITEAGLEVVGQLKSLRKLGLVNTPIQNPAAAAGLPELETLLLNYSKVRADGLASVHTIPKLRVLGAGGMQVTDQGVIEIGKCAGLEELSIAGATLGAHGLEPLLALTKLKHLSLKDGKVDPADLQKLKEALPECKVAQ